MINKISVQTMQLFWKLFTKKLLCNWALIVKNENLLATFASIYIYIYILEKRANQ